MHKRSLFIGVGCNSAIAQSTLGMLSNYDSSLLLSRQNGTCRLGSTVINLTTCNATKFNDLEKVIIDSNLPLKTDLDEVNIVSFLGTKDPGALINLRGEQIDEVITTNFSLNAYLSSILISRYRGISMSFVFISSSGALAGDSGVTLYSATKHALNGLSRGIALEYGKYGVNANVLALGVVEIGLSKNVPEKRINEMISRTANRKKVDVANIASSINFLLRNKDVNGFTMACDAGYF